MSADDLRGKTGALLEKRDLEGTLVHYTVYDYNDDEQGTALALVTEAFDDAKTYMSFNHVAASDSYYQWYGDKKSRGSDGAMGHPSCFHTRASAEICKAPGFAGCEERRSTSTTPPS